MECIVGFEGEIPKKSHDTDAGWDLTSGEWRVIHPGKGALVYTYTKVALPVGYSAMVRGRSGLARNGLSVHPGTIDHGYNDWIGVVVWNHSENAIEIKRGDRIAQLVVEQVIPVQWQEAELSSNRGGFGSTGR